MRIKFDYFNNKSEWKSKEIPLDDLYAQIKSGKYGKQCSQLSYKLAVIPNIHAETTLEDAERLPVVRFGQGEDGSYTGYVLLSFKGAIADIREHLRREAKKLPQTLMTFEGSSKKSMKIVVAFTLPDGTVPVMEDAPFFHQHAYYMAARYYEAQLGAAAEKKSPRVDRGCRISADSSVYLNSDVKPMVMAQPSESLTDAVVKNHPIAGDIHVSHSLPNYDEEQMKVLKFQYCYQQSLKEGKEEMDLFLMHLARACQKNGLDEEFAVRRVLHITPFGDYGQIVRGCFRNVYSNGEPGSDCSIPEPTIQMSLLIDFLRRKYKFRRNSMTGENEYVEEGKYMFDWAPLTKPVMNRMTIEALSEGIIAWDKDIKRYVESSYVNEYSPIQEFLQTLPVWDGKDRITELALRVPTANKVWPEYFHTWLLAMVSQWMGQNKIHGNALVPLLIGAQGDGKSTFCKLILPEELRMYYTDRIDFANKNDAERSLSRFALINIDEFDSITKRQQAFLKLILQKTSSMLRQLYSANIRETPRLSAFIATTNEPTPLTDPSGSRRYLCIRTEGIIDTRTPIDYAQLFAQLKDEINEGERTWFTGDDEADIQRSNREFEQFDSNKEIFLELFHKPKGSENGENMPLSRIIHEMHLRNRSIKEDDATFKKVGKMLKRMSFKHKHSRTGSEYYIIRNSAVTTP